MVPKASPQRQQSSPVVLAADSWPSSAMSCVFFWARSVPWRRFRMDHRWKCEDSDRHAVEGGRGGNLRYGLLHHPSVQDRYEDHHRLVRRQRQPMVYRSQAAETLRQQIPRRSGMPWTAQPLPAECRSHQHRSRAGRPFKRSDTADVLAFRRTLARRERLRPGGRHHLPSRPPGISDPRKRGLVRPFLRCVGEETPRSGYSSIAIPYSVYAPDVTNEEADALPRAARSR